ncbi:hypothetical protein NC651_009600 [Populus alba x Populus x berolinensis]|nr:hypothetical protein NC651_009600 [Populus alba x Populus x berolinensis]
MDHSHEVSLDINEIANSLREQLKINKAFSEACCIYRVPERLRKLNEKAYTPRGVSIGPLHHGKENLKAMEGHKIMYLQQFLGQNLLVSLEDLINIIKENETKLRDSYAETIDLSRKDFATMILLDAVFIIMVLLNWKYMSEFHESRRSDHIFYRPFKINDVVFDMSLLENQLPFFILQKLFERSSGAANPQNCTLTELTCGLFKCQWPDWVKEDSLKIIDSSGVLHFVDFLQKCQQPTEKHSPAKEEAFLSAPTATELHQSGVTFKRSDKSSLLDITFNNGILEIPQLKIYDEIESLFRNLQAFEQCHNYANGDTFVNDYITFISCLVSATKDVEVLAQNENLKNMLSSDETVSNLFHNLVIENVTSSETFLSGLCEELNLHCRKRRHKWKANLKQVYFNNPWTGISVFAATFLLVLTVIQTVCSILQL